MSTNVTRDLIGMVVRIAAIAVILGLFYATIGVGETPQLLCIGGAAAFGSQAASYGVRRIAGDQRINPLLIGVLALLGIGCAIAAVLIARG